jgi:endonuclease/exonuclease/phosphatase family metal-dependent hydrolase
MIRTLVCALTCALVAVFTGITSADAALPTPRNVHASASTATTLTIAWSRVTGARAYRVQISGASTMRSPRYQRVNSTQGVIRGLTPRKRYWFRVAVINPTSGARISAYTRSPFPSAVTKAVAIPSALTVTSTTTTSATLAWGSSEGASRYQVQVDRSTAFTSPVTATTTALTRTLSGLEPGTDYFLRVRAVRTDGTALTGYSAAVPARTAAAAVTPPTPTSTQPYDLRVGSYNIQSVSLDKTLGEQRPWRDRRAGVIADILGEDVDVVGIQEGNQSYSFASRLVDGRSQILDLRNGLNNAGGSYALTNTNAFNCVNPDSSYQCQYKYQGASGGDHILYNTETLTLVSHGSFKYATQQAVSPLERYLAYAVFQINSTGKRFLFTSTHLDADRGTEWKEVVSKVNSLKGTLPVINVGDYNTQKYDPIAAEMLPAFKAAGYGDVLNQEYRQNPIRTPRALKSVNGWIYSFNHDYRDVHLFACDRTDKTGNNIDLIFATNSLVVKEWKVVVDYDPTTMQVLGTLPSDHNMVRATITVP